MKTVELNGTEFITLCALLKVAGLCNSGGEAKNLIADGLVKVDGEVELRKRCKIREGQVVEFESMKVQVVA